MKKFHSVLIVFLAAALLLSACKTNTPTPPGVVPTEPPVVEETSAPTEEGAVMPTEEVQSTGCPTPDPSEDLTLFDEDNRMICNIYEGFFPPLTEEQSAMLEVFPEITEEDWVRGPEDAILTVMEYSDFQCPACVGFYAELETLVEKYPDDVRIVFRHLPLLSLHPNAAIAAQASEAAGLQGKFWEMYDLLYSRQSEGFQLSAEDFGPWLEGLAKDLDLDVDQFISDYTSDEIVTSVQEDMNFALETIGLNATPTILLNGRPWSYSWSASALGMVVDVLKYEKEGLYTECPPWVIDQDKEYTATIQTEKGDIVIDLFPKEAPLTVNSFVFLAQEGFYDGITFHRVMHDFVAQTGDPSGTGISSAGYEYRDEISQTLNFDEPGMLGMANGGPDTNGSQFFITYVPYSQLNCSYTIFGKLADEASMEVLKQLTERDPQNDPDAPEGDKIIGIIIEEE